jgi:cytoskeleton protein RodZ
MFHMGVGDILRERRESFGQDLTAVAAQLHIRQAYLKAIEDGRFKDLPGLAYASGFVRSYGDYLGLDGEELVRQFRAEVAGINRQVQLSFPSIATEGKIPGGAVLLLSAVLAVFAYGIWYYMADRQKGFVDSVPEVPAQMRALLGKQAPTTNESATKGPAVVASTGKDASNATSKNSPGTGAAASDVGPGDGSAADAKPGSASTSAPTAATQTAEPAPKPASPPPPATSVLVNPDDLAPLPSELGTLIAAANAAAPTGSGSNAVSAPAAPAKPTAQLVVANPGARVKLVARMDSWVQIYDKAGKSYYSAVLRSGQAIEVPDQPGLLMTTGNVGGLDIMIDGQAQPALGSVGLVKRDLPLDPAALKSAFSTLH